MKLHLVTDGRRNVAELVKIITDIHTAADAIHIREKNKSAGELIELVEALHRNGVPKSKLVMNDRVDAAVLSGLHQVQLPSHSFDVKVVKQRFPHLVAGCSVHSAAEAIYCAENGADRLLFGHVFQTSSKEGLKARGIGALKEIAESVSIPVIAIGGIIPAVITEIRDLKIEGAAVMSYVFSSNHPYHAAREIAEQLKGGMGD